MYIIYRKLHETRIGQNNSNIFVYQILHNLLYTFDLILFNWRSEMSSSWQFLCVARSLQKSRPRPCCCVTVQQRKWTLSASVHLLSFSLHGDMSWYKSVFSCLSLHTHSISLMWFQLDLQKRLALVSLWMLFSWFNSHLIDESQHCERLRVTATVMTSHRRKTKCILLNL